LIVLASASSKHRRHVSKSSSSTLSSSESSGGDVSSKSSNTMIDYDGIDPLKIQEGAVFHPNRSSCIVFRLTPQYFSDNPAYNKKLVNCESLKKAVRLVISEFGLKFPSDEKEKLCMDVVEHLHYAFVKRKMTNAHAINIFSYIAHCHNVFTDIGPGLAYGLTQICWGVWFKKLDEIRGKADDYYSADPCRLNRFNRKTIGDEIILYKREFSTAECKYAYTLTKYGPPESGHIDLNFGGSGGVSEEAVRKMPEDDLSKLLRQFHLNRIFGKIIAWLHEMERKSIHPR